MNSRELIQKYFINVTTIHHMCKCLLLVYPETKTTITSPNRLQNVTQPQNVSNVFVDMTQVHSFLLLLFSTTELLQLKIIRKQIVSR